MAPTPYPRGTGIWIPTSTFVRRPCGQRAPVETVLAALAVGPCCVVQTAQAAARMRITVAHSIEIHIPAALAPAAGLGGSGEPERIPEKAIFAVLTASSYVWKEQVWRAGQLRSQACCITVTPPGEVERAASGSSWPALRSLEHCPLAAWPRASHHDSLIPAPCFCGEDSSAAAPRH